MRIPLEGDEHVVVRTRRHPRALRGPVWVLLFLMFLVGVVLGLLTRVPSLGSGWTTATPYLIGLTWLSAGVAALAWVLKPVLRWLRTHIVITTRWLWIFRGRRTVQKVPLTVVDQVHFKSGLGGGAHGPGTLDLHTSQGKVSIHHCPDVKTASGLVEDLVHRARPVPAWMDPVPDPDQPRYPQPTQPEFRIT